MATARRSRRDSNQARSIVGAARRVKLDRGAAAIRRAMGERESWQAEMWAYFDSTPEFKQAVIYTGSVASKVRVFGAAVPDGDEDGDPIPVTAEESGISPELAAAVTEELAKLRSPLGGQPEILRLINMNLEVAGECFLVGRGPRDAVVDPRTEAITVDATTEAWTVHSISEVHVNSSGLTLVKEDGKGRGIPLDPEQGDSIIRIWVRHPQWTSRPDTAWRGCLMDLRTLQALANERLAVSQGNMVRGLFKISNNVALAGPSVAPAGDGEEDPVLSAISRAMVDSAQDPDDVHSLDYVYVKADKDDLASDVFGPVDLARKRDSQLAGEIEASVLRIARGANLPPEKLLGHQQTTFANATAVDLDEFEDYHDPRMRAIVDALTVGFLIPNLLAREQQFDAGQLARVIAWFDPSDLFREPNSEEAADKGMELLTISGAAWRNKKGFTEDDAPDPLELIIRTALGTSRIPPEIVLAMLEPLAKEAGIELPTPAQSLIPATAPLEAPGSTQAAFQDRLLLAALQIQQALHQRDAIPASSALAPVTARTGVPDLGARLTAIDTRLRAQLVAAASAAMERALERAGNKLRNRLTAANKDLVQGVPARLVAARLGPSLVADAASDDDLLDGAWDDFTVTYVGLTLQAQKRARALAARLVPFDVEAVETVQTADTAASADWLVERLREVALQRLYNPDPTVPPGEANPALTVPEGVIRSGLARAGGATSDGETGPVGGAALGDTMLRALTDGGATVGRYTWVYSNSAHPLPLHEDLDGVEFNDYDDPVLANTEDFPPHPFAFAGDHLGCGCDASPTIVLDAVIGRNE